MKLHLNNYFIFIVCTITFLFNKPQLKAQTIYHASMQDAQQKLAFAKTEIDFNKTSELYFVVAQSEKDNWLPYYYAGLCKALAAITLKNKNADALCNQADVYIKKADSLSPNSSEIAVLKSLNYSARLNVNPKARAIKYNKHINQANEMAMKLDSKNPRAYLQKAQSVYYSPEAFGGGAKKALPLFELALEKFNAFKPETVFMPKWGKDITEKMIAECKAKIQKAKSF